MGTGNAVREGVESRNDRVGRGRWFQDASRQLGDWRAVEQVDSEAAGNDGAVLMAAHSRWSTHPTLASGSTPEPVLLLHPFPPPHATRDRNAWHQPGAQGGVSCRNDDVTPNS